MIIIINTFNNNDIYYVIKLVHIQTIKQELVKLDHKPEGISYMQQNLNDANINLEF